MSKRSASRERSGDGEAMAESEGREQPIASPLLPASYELYRFLVEA